MSLSAVSYRSKGISNDDQLFWFLWPRDIGMHLLDRIDGVARSYLLDSCRTVCRWYSSSVVGGELAWRNLAV